MPAPPAGGDLKPADGPTLADCTPHVPGPTPSGVPAPARPTERLKKALAQQLRRPALWAAVILLALVAAGLILALPHLGAWYHLSAARTALERYHNPQAIRHLQACLRVWPTDADALLLAARAARRARTYGEAAICLEKYQRIRGLDSALSFEQLLLSAERNVDSVADVCRRHVEQGHADTPLILEALTRGYLRQYRLQAARSCLERWLKSQPDNPQALCLMGEFHLDYERASHQAVESYRRAIQLDPDHEEARMGLAIVLLQTKNYSEAAEHLHHLRECQPDNLRVQVGLAECRQGLGQVDAAVRLVDRVLARQPQYVPALTLRGQLALERKDFTAAEAWLRQAVARDPGNHQARYSLILCLHHNGKDEEAVTHKQQLTKMEEAVKRFNEIVTRDMIQRPHDPALHYTLGQLLLGSGHQEQGLRWLNSALHEDPQYAPARQALAEFYKKSPVKERPASGNQPSARDARD
jgi:tetratricopeptide (TPR) repeat protein